MTFSHSQFLYDLVLDIESRWQRVMSSKNNDHEGRILDEYYSHLRKQVPLVYRKLTEDAKDVVIASYFDDVWFLAAKPDGGEVPAVHYDSNFPELRSVTIGDIQGSEMLLGVDTIRSDLTIYSPLAMGVVRIKRDRKTDLYLTLEEDPDERENFLEVLDEVVGSERRCQRYHVRTLKRIMKEVRRYRGYLVDAEPREIRKEPPTVENPSISVPLFRGASFRN